MKPRVLSRCALAALSLGLAFPTVVLGQEGVVIPAGTRIVTTLENEINTKSAREGDKFRCKVTVPVTAAGEIVIPQGSEIHGTVGRIERKTAGRKGQTTMQLMFDEIELPNGTKVAIDAKLVSTRQAKKVLTRGRDIVLKVGDELTLELKAPLALTRE